MDSDIEILATGENDKDKYLVSYFVNCHSIFRSLHSRQWRKTKRNFKGKEVRFVFYIGVKSQFEK